jgi:hypothetical protein
MLTLPAALYRRRRVDVVLEDENEAEEAADNPPWYRGTD